MLRQCVHSFTVATCLIVTIFLVAKLDELDGFELWASLIAAGATNTVVTAFIVGGHKPGTRERKEDHS